MPDITTPSNDDQNDQTLHLSREHDADRLQQIFNDLIETNESQEVFYLIVDVERVLHEKLSNLGQQNPQLFKLYQRILARAKWFVIDHFGPGTVEELFRNFFEFGFSYSWTELLEKLRVVLMVIPSREERDHRKEEWRNAMAQSVARLGNVQIVVAGLEHQTPTIAHWLKDFRDYVGNAQITPLHIVEYLNGSDNVELLDVVTHAQLENVLKIYFELTKSSLTPEGMEEELTYMNPFSGTYHVWDRGKDRDTEVPLPLSDVRELRDIFGLDDDGKQIPLPELVKRGIREEEEFSTLLNIKSTSTPTIPEKKVEDSSLPIQKISMSQPQPITISKNTVPSRVLHTIPLQQEALKKKVSETLPASNIPQPSSAPMRTIRKPSYTDAARHIQKETTTPPPSRENVSDVPEDIFATANPMIDAEVRKVRHTPSSTISPLSLSSPVSRSNGNGMRRKQGVITDITMPANVVRGPLEELASMTVTDLRRFGNDPVAATQKILQKIQLLEEDSFEKRTEGIAAWKRSPLHQLYVRIGRAGLEQTRSVEDIMQSWTAEGKETLHPEEFNAMSDMNRQLRA